MAIYIIKNRICLCFQVTSNPDLMVNINYGKLIYNQDSYQFITMQNLIHYCIRNITVIIQRSLKNENLIKNSHTNKQGYRGPIKMQQYNKAVNVAYRQHNIYIYLTGGPIYIQGSISIEENCPEACQTLRGPKHLRSLFTNYQIYILRNSQK